MSQFFEKNKRKSLLALLLLLLRGKKGVGAMLLMVFLLMFLFVLPQNSLSLFVAGIAAKLPGGQALARRIGRGSGTDFSNLMAAFRAARDQRNAGWGVFFDSEAAKRGRGARGGASSIDMIKGGREDFLAGANLGNKIKGGESVGGILTPEDAGRTGEGVALGGEDLEGQRQAQLAAVGALGPGGVGSGSANPLNFVQRGLLKLGAGLGGFGFGKSGAGEGGGAGGSTSAAYAPKDFFSGRGGASTPDPGREAIAGGTTPPSSSGGGNLPGGVRGRLAAELSRASNTTRLAASARQPGGCSGSRCAFQQLTSGRTNMMLARDPICTASNGCPPEFAATSSGSSFDGNRIGGPDAPRVITSGDPANAPVIDGIATPNVNVPDTSEADQYIREAEELQQDANTCRDSDERYRLESERVRGEMQALGQMMEDRGCGDGDCSRSKARWCKARANELRAKCREVNVIEHDRCMACPIRARQGCNQPAADCS